MAGGPFKLFFGLGGEVLPRATKCESARGDLNLYVGGVVRQRLKAHVNSHSFPPD